MTQTVSIDELRTNLSQVIGRVMYGKNRVVVKKYNKDAVVMLSVEEYEQLKSTSKRMSKREWNAGFAFIDSIRERISDEDQEKLEKIITDEVKAIRAEKQKKLRV